MLLHYLTLSLRLMIRNPMQTIISVAGLSLGLTCYFVLWGYSSRGLSADRFHEGADRTWRVGCYWRWKEDDNVGQMTCGAVPIDQTRLILQDYAGKIAYTRFLQQPEFDGITTRLSSENTVRLETDSSAVRFNETDIIEADQNLFEFFTLPLRYGTPQTALAKANAVALSVKTSRKYYGNANPIGRHITFNDTISMEVTAVFEDIPSNSHLDFEMVVSNVGQLRQWDIRRGTWGRLYLRFEAERQDEEFYEFLQVNHKKYWERERAAWVQSDAEHFLQPLTDIIFSKFYWSDHFKHQSYLLLWTLRWLSLAIVLVAWINHLNLTVASIGKRLKEVGTRKTSGAGVNDVMIQFGLESLVVHLLALFAAITIIQLASGWILAFLELDAASMFTTWSLGLVFSYILLCSWIVALYPASLSGATSVKSLYGSARGFGWMPRVSAMLSVFQFALALGLMICGLVAGNQLWRILNHDLGIRTSNILVVNLPLPTSPSDPARLQNLISELRGKYNVSYCYSIAGDASQFRIAPIHPRSNYVVQINVNGGVDETFIPLMGLKLLAGRNFVPNDRSDGIILSRYVTERLGFPYPEEAIGVRLKLDDKGGKQAEIIGVIEDYILEPMVSYGEKRNVAKAGNGDGLCLTYKQGIFPQLIPRKLLVQTDPEESRRDVLDVEKLVRQSFPHYAVQTSFLKDYINRAYETENHFGIQVSVLMIFAIVISCLGFFGSVANRIVQRTKEIGIRKVHGAKVIQLGLWLLKSSMLQMASAICLAVPIAYLFSVEYLKRYSVVFPLSFWHFLLPPVTFVLILLATVSGVIWKAARTNPVESLRYE